MELSPPPSERGALPGNPSTLDSVLFESSPDCVKLLDSDGAIQAMNRNGRCLMQIDDFCMIAGKPWATLWPPESQQLVRDAVATACRGEASHFNAYCPTAGGIPKWWDVMVTPIYRDDGAIDSLMSVSRDVTEVHQANEAMLEAGARFSLLLESSGNGICGIDRDGVCTFINQFGAAMLGERAADLIGRPLQAIVGNGAPGSALANAIQEASATHLEDDVFVGKDGHAIPVACSVSPMLVAGLHAGTVLTFTDISERKRAEVTQHESRERLEKIISQAATGVVQADIDGRITLVNQKYCAMMGYTQAELLGRSVLEVTAPGFIEQTISAVAALRHGGASFVIEKQYQRRDGSLMWATSSVNALHDRDGHYQGLVAIVVDISEHKIAEEKLRDADQRKDEFLAMLAHELRNPLAPIGAAAELLRSAHFDEQRVRKTSEVISRQVLHMTSLVDDLLDVSRVTRGLVELERLPIDIAQVVSDAVEQLTPLIDLNKHTLRVQLAAGQAVVEGDKKRLVQVIANLLNNAAKYTPVGGKIDLTTVVSATHVLVTVGDDGIGMDPDLAGRVFDLFAQGKRSPDRSSGGLGIGLALAKNMVTLHGGRIFCESRGIGKGSRFSISLPRLVAKAPEQAPLAQPMAASGSRQLRIMIVDDNVDAAMMLGMVLEIAGHRITIEHDALEALEAARSGQHDVFLLDIGLPQINGNQLAQQLRADPASAAALLIAVTGYGQQSDKYQATQAGFAHYFVKPINSPKLLALLDAVPAPSC